MSRGGVSTDLLNCKQGGIATIVQNPLGNLDSTHRTYFVFGSEGENKGHDVDRKEALLLRVCERRGPGRVSTSMVIRGEVVLVRDK